MVVQAPPGGNKPTLRQLHTSSGASAIRTAHNSNNQHSSTASSYYADGISIPRSPSDSASSVASSSGSPRSFHSAATPPGLASFSDAGHSLSSSQGSASTITKGHRRFSSTVVRSNYQEAELYDGRPPPHATDEGEGEDLGDRTITQHHQDPFANGDDRFHHSASSASSWKGKGRAHHEDDEDAGSYRYSDTADQAGLDQTVGLTEAEYEEVDADDDENESRRIEENLRKWAKKEKLRRAKTRNRQGSYTAPPPPPAIVSEGFAAVTDLARRVSGRQRKGSGSEVSVTTRSSGVVGGGGRGRSGSTRLDSLESRPGSSSSVFGDRDRGHDGDGELLELQATDSKRRRPPNISTGPLDRAQPADSVDNVVLISPPLPTASSGYAEGRIERAAKTGSRFIEDLEDQEMLPHTFGHQLQQQQSDKYAQLSSATSSLHAPSPLSSPTKKQNLWSPRNKLRLKLGGFGSSHNNDLDDDRTRSIMSVSSLHSYDSSSKDPILLPNSARTVDGRFPQSLRSPSPGSLKSPTDGTVTPRYQTSRAYYMHPDESSSRLVLSAPRISKDYPRRSSEYEDDDDEAGYADDEDHRRGGGRGAYARHGSTTTARLGFLEWLFCCGCCCSSGVRLDEDEEQAGKTFPE